MGDSEGWLPWLVHINDPSFGEMWRTNPTFLIANLVYLTSAGLSLKFALRHGVNSRYTYLWIATLLHGIVTELVSYNLPDINNFWHTQTFMIFAGRRFPLYIVLFYPASVVHAYIAASRLRLPWWAEPFAVGLFDLLLDFPYDIMGIKMVWWTWHDTDPNIFDRMYWVPWTSYFFHLAFHSSLAFLMNASRYLITGNADKDKSAGFFKEMLCVLITAAFSMPFAAVFQMLPLYHGLKDGFGLHSEVIMFVVFGLYVGIVWYADRNPNDAARSQIKSEKSWWKNETGVAALLIYVFHMILVVVAKPQDVVSYGMHEPLGPKAETMEQAAMSGVVYTKQRYFDPSSYDEGYIDFHCVEDGAPNITAKLELIGEDWYTICGNDFGNRAEYIVIIWSFCLLGIYSFYNALARSATQDVVDGKHSRPKPVKMKEASKETKKQKKKRA